MIKTIKCGDCEAELEINTNARYKRKYCEKCSKKRKKLWDEQWKVKFEDLEDE